MTIMDTFDPDTFEMKYRIADSATTLYLEGDGHFLIKDIADKLGIDPAEIFDFFPNKKAILEFYYTSLIYRYEMMISEIENFDTYTLSEKFSNFVYSSFEMMGEKQQFVEETYRDLILCSFGKTEFEKEIEELIDQFLQNDPRLATSTSIVLNDYSYSFLRRQYLELLRFWLNDTSEGKELTMELTDKLTSVFEELMYNAILDRSFDLLKFMIANREKFLNNIPIIKQLYQKIEIR